MMADVRGKARRRATTGGIISMPGRKIGVEVGAKIAPATWVLGEDMGKGLGDEVVFRVEMAIEAAMGEPGGLHHFCDADRIEPLPAKQPAGDFQ